LVKSIGKYEHLESGTVIAHVNDNITLEILDLTLIIIFKSDRTISEPTIKATGGGKDAVFTFINYDSGLGHVNTVPLPFGTYNGRKLFMNYVIYSFGGPAVAKLIHYTFMFAPSE
jgi:hypothetical protein